jgi:hypothetical protein
MRRLLRQISQFSARVFVFSSIVPDDSISGTFPLKNKVVDGATFKSQSNNQYYSFISKLAPIEEATQKTKFTSIHEVKKKMHFDPTKHLLLRLIIEDDTKYFVEECAISLTQKAHVRVEVIHTTREILKQLTFDGFVPITE